MEINPFDITSGKVVQNHNGTFWFKEPGYNMQEDGWPIVKNLHRDNDLPAAIHTDGTLEWYKNGECLIRNIVSSDEMLKGLKSLVGKTIIGITAHVGESAASYEDHKLILLTFTTSNSGKNYYQFYHKYDCCEHVWLEDIVGDPNDLLNTPILKAEESTTVFYLDTYERVRCTFYKFATIKGYVDIRFNGESNGYYSESIDLKVSKLRKTQ